jgi:Raf kinase inhibitor-like YbhB/YbcL family protein
MKIHLGKLRISSPSFSHGQRIPDRHAVGEKPTSPPLAWSDPPGGTQSYAFVVHDPDAPLTYGFTHWVLYGIPASTTGIAEGGGDGFVQGLNSKGGHKYVPPAPPPGHGDHFYYFNLYALDEDLDLPPGLSSAELLERIDDHIIEQARIVGTYSNLTQEAWHH